MSYQVWHATTTGPSHASSDAPCQDAYSVATSADGVWTSIAVCDGCGNAKKADIGARFASDYMAASLLELAEEVEKKGPGEWVIDRSVVLLSILREKLRGAFGDDISEYAATIVAVLISERGGFIIHIGDGVASSIAVESKSKTPALNVLAQSDPENGEYINQTFYLTEPSWIRHVRITALRNVECLVLCTDGAQALFYEGNKPYDGALLPVFQSLRRAASEGNAFLSSVMSNPEADARSTDDKTIAIIARPGFLEAASKLAYAPKADNKPQTQPKPDAAQIVSVARSIRTSPQPKIVGRRLPFSYLVVGLMILSLSLVATLLISGGYIENSVAFVRNLRIVSEAKPTAQKADRKLPKSHPTLKNGKPN